MVPEWAWFLIRQELKTAGFTDSVLSRLKGTPIPELRILFGRIALTKAEAEIRELIAEPAALASFLVSKGLVPDGTEAEWAAGTLVNYYRPLSPRGAWTASYTLGQRAVDFVASRGGSCAVDTLLGEIGVLSGSTANALSAVLGRYTKEQAAVLETDEELRNSTVSALRRDVTVRLIACPTLSGPTHAGASRHGGTKATAVRGVPTDARSDLSLSRQLFPDGHSTSTAPWSSRTWNGWSVSRGDRSRKGDA